MPDPQPSVPRAPEDSAGDGASPPAGVMPAFGGGPVAVAPSLQAPPRPPPDFSHFRAAALRARQDAAEEGGGAGGEDFDEVDDGVDGDPAGAEPDQDPLGISGPGPARAAAQRGPSRPPAWPPAGQEVEGDDVTLLDWLRQWQYQAGMSYISIHRRAPAMVRGYHTGGHLEDALQPFDQEALGDRWGGGTFLVEVWQYDNGSGRTLRADHRPVTIGGAPTHYRGPDGEPAPLPGAVDGEGAGAWGARPTPGAGPNAGPWTPAWVSRTEAAARSAAGAINTNADNIRMMELLRDSTKESANAQVKAYEIQNRALQSRLDFVEKRGTDNAQAAWGPVDRTVESVRKQLEDQRAAYDSQLREQRTGFETTLRSREEAHAREMAAVRAQNDAAMSALRAEHGVYLADLRDRHKQDVDGLREEIRRADARVVEARTSTEGMLKAQYEGRIAALEAELRTTRDQTERERKEADRIRTEGQAETQRVRDELSALQKERGKGLSANLTEFAGVMGAFGKTAEAFGFKPAGEGGEPTDTVGRVLHHLPAISQHVLGPIGARIDNLADAVRQKRFMEAQAAVQQRQVAAAAHLPAALPPPGWSSGLPVVGQPEQAWQPPQGSSPQQVYGLPQQAPAQPVQQAPAAPGPAQAAVAPAGDGSDPRMVEMVRQLQGRFDADAPPVAVAAEIRAVVPPQDIALMAASPPDDVVGAIVQTAGPDSPFATPRGADWLRAVHGALTGA